MDGDDKRPAESTVDKNKGEETEGGTCGKNCKWISYCLLAGFLIGTGAFIYANSFGKYGMDGSGILGPGATVMFLSIKFVREVIFLEKNGQWTRTKKSAWVKEDGSVRWISLVPLFFNVACNVGVTIVMTYAWNFAA